MRTEYCPEIPRPMPGETREQRAWRIDILKRLILDGKYPVDPESLADSILAGGHRRSSNRYDNNLERRREYMRNYMREKRASEKQR